MGADRRDILTHPRDVRPRRVAVQAIGALALASLIGRLSPGSGAARNKKKPGGKKKDRDTCVTTPCPTCPADPAPATCPGTCDSRCAQCFLRPGASPLCGHGATPNCALGCSSDTDCVGTNRPYCLTHVYRSSDAQTSNVCPAPGGWCSAVVGCIF
jgi:hypothetical protein